MSSLKTAALALAAKGMRVFPLWPGTKEPLIKEWPKRATTDIDVVRGWWRSGHYNLAIATGEGSGIWVLDVDGDEGRETLATLEEQHGQLPSTIEVTTPGKINKKTGAHSGRGLHLYFRYPLGLDIRNAQDRNDLPGLDWRGNGGYVCAPPSLHPDGGNYAWSVDSASKFADAPAWLLDLVTSESRRGGDSAASTPEQWRTVVNETHEGSRRGNAIARLSGLLLRRFLDPLVALDLVRLFNAAHCVPPLADDDVIRIVTDIANLEKQRRESAP
jgi:hypothetical protein